MIFIHKQKNGLNVDMQFLDLLYTTLISKIDTSLFL